MALRLQNVTKRSRPRRARVNASILCQERPSDFFIFFFLFINEFLSTVNAGTAPPPLRREPLGGKQGWCLVKPHREPKLHQRQEKRKLLHSCAGSHSNAAVPIFKNLKDSKNIKSEGRKKKSNKKQNTFLSERKKNMHVFLTGSSDETAYG